MLSFPRGMLQIGSDKMMGILADPDMQHCPSPYFSSFQCFFYFPLPRFGVRARRRWLLFNILILFSYLQLCRINKYLNKCNLFESDPILCSEADVTELEGGGEKANLSEYCTDIVSQDLIGRLLYQ